MNKTTIIHNNTGNQETMAINMFVYFLLLLMI